MKNARPRASRNSPVSGLADTSIAPATTSRIAPHWNADSDSPSRSAPAAAANTGPTCCSGTARETSSRRNP